MQEVDTYSMTENGETVFVVGQERLASAEERAAAQLNDVTDLDRLRRMVRRAVEVASWQDILDTP